MSYLCLNYAITAETAALVVRSIQNLSTPAAGADPKAAASAATTDGDGRIIIMTLHQPSSDIWEMIDHLVILAQGYIVYNGPAVDAMDFFVSIGFKRPAHVNPADFFLDIVQCEEDADDTQPTAAASSAAAASGSGGGAMGAPGTVPSARSGRHPGSLPRLNVPSASNASNLPPAPVNPAAAVVARTRSSKKLRAKFLATAWRHHERIMLQSRRLAAAAGGAGAGAGAAASVAGAGVAAAVGWTPAPLRQLAAPTGGREGRKAKLEDALRRYNERMQQQQLNGDGNEEGDALGSDMDEDSQASGGGGDYDDDV